MSNFDSVVGPGSKTSSVGENLRADNDSHQTADMPSFFKKLVN